MYRTVVDRTNELSYALGYKAVPNGVLLDAEGAILYAHYGGFTVSGADTLRRLDTLLQGDQVSRTPPLTGSIISQEDARQARLLLDQGARGYDEDPIDALRLWKEALQLDRDNYCIRKQIWAVEHPEKFYPEIDWDWQKEQLRAERESEKATRAV